MSSSYRLTILVCELLFLRASGSYNMAVVNLKCGYGACPFDFDYCLDAQPAEEELVKRGLLYYKKSIVQI